MATKKYITENGIEYNFSDKDEINRGGEGIIYKTKDNKLVAKIFHSNNVNLTVSKFNFLQKLNKNIFITPQSILKYADKIAGYIMEYIQPEFNPISAFFNSAFCQKNNIDDKIKLKISQNLINAVKSAHDNSIIIGDLNQFNVLVNLKGEIKIIDTDSFETPGEKHSGKMLEEIRDYLYNGQISTESDYFALAVNIFNLFTYTHPFKGIHSKHKRLQDRMIHKISVLSQDIDLKIPKCFRDISDVNLNEQFFKIFNEGQRFLISVDSTQTKVIQDFKPIKIQTDEKDVSIKQILENENILNACFAKEQGFIETSDRFIVFNSNQKTYVSRKAVISKNIVDEIFIGNKNIILKKEEKLYNYINENQIIELSNINIKKNTVYQKIENILISVDEESMHTIYIDEIINNSVKNERTPVSGKSFTNYNGFIQNIGGKRRIFYNTGKNIATTKSDKNLKAVYQIENAGIISEIENDKLVNRFFNIKGLEIEFSEEISNFSHIAFMKTDKENGFIFEPSHEKINIYRTQDFALISEISCNIINEQTRLYYTNSGIIAINENSAFLVNKN